MTQIDYNHQDNLHTQEGARAALPIIFSDWKPASVLDVGCGTGTWLSAALEFGISDVFGVDGVAIPPSQLLISDNFLMQQDFTLPWNLNRKFDVVLCLEVAEHLDASFAKGFIETLTSHADIIVFAAACPGQLGQHHVNCQWPAYWQQLFNEMGFVCHADVRWRMWQNSQIEPWYRQNVFIAKYSPSQAGQEERIQPIIHPEMLPMLLTAIEAGQENIQALHLEQLQQVETGSLDVGWYVRTPFKALYTKFWRKLVPAS
jgi:SAM-dependent methyltransferase